MLVAAAAALSALPDLFRSHNELQALDFAWFLIYLQIILFFQRKDERTYWLLVMLSLLQVVMATLFSQGIGFGLFLVVYMLLGFSAMTLLMMYRQWERYQPKDDGPAVDGHGSGGKARWPLGKQPHECVGLPAGSSHSEIRSRSVSAAGPHGTVYLGLALALFFAMPRFGQFAWRGEIAQPQPLVGFTDKVTLGQLGQIIESREDVMRVGSTKGPTTRPPRSTAISIFRAP